MQRKLKMLACAYLILVAGCGYGEVSPTAYELSMSLYNVSNRQLADRLPLIEERIAAALSSGEITPREAKWLDQIVDLADNNEWKQAMKASRRMMEDQIVD